MKKKSLFSIFLFFFPLTSFSDVGNISYSFINDKETTAEIKIKQVEGDSSSAYLDIMCSNYKNDYSISIHNLNDKNFSSTSYEPKVLFKNQLVDTIWKSGYMKNKNFLYKIDSNKEFIYQLKLNGQVLISFENESQIIFFNATDKQLLSDLLDNMSEHCSLTKIE